MNYSAAVSGSSIQRPYSGNRALRNLRRKGESNFSFSLRVVRAFAIAIREELNEKIESNRLLNSIISSELFKTAVKVILYSLFIVKSFLFILNSGIAEHPTTPFIDRLCTAAFQTGLFIVVVYGLVSWFKDVVTEEKRRWTRNN